MKELLILFFLVTNKQKQTKRQFKMKKIVLVLFSLLTMFLGSCRNTSDDIYLGGGEPCRISSKDVTIKEEKEAYYIDIPANGKDFSLTVNNYQGWNIASISTRESDKGEFKLAYYCGQNKEAKDKDWYEFYEAGNKANCSIKQNSLSTARTIELVMSTGDVACHIYIRQAAK